MMSWEDPMLGSVFLGGYFALLTLVWLLMIFANSQWGRAWKIDKPIDSPKADAPSVSICIPARNEAENIGDCVRSALASDWPNLEVIVVDDRSDDRTGAIAIEAGAGDPRLKVIEGVEPIAGWAGKPWTCLRAAKESKGAWLLFIDADVRIDPKAVQAGVETGIENDLALLSFFGTWKLVTFWERVLIPAVGWLIRGSVDLDRVNSLTHSEAFANGQFILMSRKGYFAIDGHTAVRAQVLEDVRLAEVVKRNGFAAQIRPAAWAFQVRLYRSLSEIVSGYTKNVYEGLGRRPMLGFGAALFLFVGSLLPFIIAIVMTLGYFAWSWGIVTPMWLLWSWLLCALQFVFRAQQEKLDGRNPMIAWTQPLANTLLIWILLRSTTKVSVKWKGRTFVDGKAE